MQARILSATLLFPLIVSAYSSDLTIVNAFPGDSAIGPKTTPDNVGAVGPEHVVDFTCANFVVHEKASGKIVLQKPQTEFWKELGFPDVHPNDPRMLYDSLSGRFVATIANDKAHRLYLAVSTSSDPSKQWKGVLTPFSSPDFGFRMGVDKNGLYGCFWNFNKDTHSMMDCCAISKADLIAAEGPNLANVQLFPGIEIESFPATDLDSEKAADAPEILLNREFGNSFSKLYMHKITWYGKTASISKVQSIPLSKTYVSPNGSSQKFLAVQPPPGGKLRGDEGRRTSSVYAHGGSVFACNAAKREIDSRCGVFWCEVKASDGTLIQEGFVDDPNCDYLAPSLAVDSAGNVGVGCTRTSETEFPSAYVMIHAASDAKGTMRTPMLGMKGTTIFSSSRAGKYGVGWGNYNSTCLDPSDPALIWTYQEFAGSATPDQFSTCWVCFKLK